MYFSIPESIFASIAIVVVVSIDRFFAIVYPMKAQEFRLKIKISALVAWVCSAAYAIPFMSSFGILERDGLYYCLRSFPPLDNTISSKIYYLTMFLFHYCAPLFDSYGSLYAHVAEALETKDPWKRH